MGQSDRGGGGHVVCFHENDQVHFNICSRRKMQTRFSG